MQQASRDRCNMQLVLHIACITACSLRATRPLVCRLLLVLQQGTGMERAPECRQRWCTTECVFQWPMLQNSTRTCTAVITSVMAVLLGPSHLAAIEYLQCLGNAKKPGALSVHSKGQGRTIAPASTHGRAMLVRAAAASDRAPKCGLHMHRQNECPLWHNTSLA